jgi:drug/metabolite transporter (DMT)-like permease
MIGIILALLSAVASGLSVVLVRKHSAGSNAFNMSLVITIVGMVILWPLAIMTTGFGELNLEGVALFAVSGVLSPGLVRLFYYKGLKTLGASGNSAIFSVYPLYSALLAVVLLSEMLSPENWIGILCIILGVVFIDLSIHGSNNAERKANRKNLIFPIIGGVMLGVSSIIRKYALNVCDTPIFGVAVAYVFSLLPYALMLMASVPTRKELALKQDFRWFWIAGIGQAVSWTLAFYALSFEQVSITNPLLSIEPLFVVVFAYLYLRELERVSPKLLASIAVTVLGVVLVTI